MNRKILAFAVTSLLATQVSAQTLTEAVQQTLATNPNILATQHNLEAAEELYSQARAGYRPSLDLVIARGRENSNNATTRGLNNAAGRSADSDFWLTREENSLKLTQMLYDGSSTRHLVKQQGAVAQAALSRLASSQETVSLRAIQVYLEMLRREGVVGLARRNLDQHEKTLERIQERVAATLDPPVNEVQTKGRRAQSKSNLLLAERDLKNGVAQFQRVVGEQPSNLVRPATISGLPITLQAALELALTNNPNLQAAQADLEAAEASHKQVLASFRPRFDLELGVTRNEDTDGSPGSNEDDVAAIRMSYNLYRGGADRARLNELEAREFAARETLRSIRRGIEEDVTVIWNELEDILLRLEYLQAHVSSTEEVLVAYNDQLALGKRTLLDLLDVQNELLRARVGLLTGQHTALFARYRVLASVGGLLDALGLETAR